MELSRNMKLISEEEYKNFIKEIEKIGQKLNGILIQLTNDKY